MKIGALIGDVVRSLFTNPATEQYPYVKQAAPDRLRGKLKWDASTCVGCGMCERECPANALEVITIDKKAKRFVLHYDVNRCIYCAQCVYSCRFNSLELDDTAWELAALTTERFKVFYGAEEDVQAVLAKEARKFADVSVTE